MIKGRDTKKTIIETGLEMASQIGLECVTIGNLSKEMQMSKSGLFAHFQSKENFQEALIHYLDQSGVYLATDTPLDVGYQFQIEIDLPVDGKVINSKCKVIWVNEIASQNYAKGMGVQFVELAPKDDRFLKEYIAEFGRA